MATRRDLLGILAAGVLASCAALRADEKALQPGLDDLQRWQESGANLAELPKQFLLDPKLSYFNTGSLGASPRVVVEAHSTFLHAIEANPAGLLFGSMGDQMETVRKKAADFIGADVDEVTFTANTTSGINMIAEALSLRAGDELLTTNQEHAGGHIGWEHARAQRGIVIREVSLPMPSRSIDEIITAIKAAITERTKVICLSHVNTITGLRMPLTHVGRLAAANGAYLVVDGAQAPGMLQVNVHELGCDAYATSCHKWMLGPKGSGLLYLSKEFQKQVPSISLYSGMGSYTAASGTRNVPQILSLGVALDFHKTIGRERIESRDLSLARRLRERLATIAGIEIVSPSASELQSAMVTLKLPSGSSDAVAAELYKTKGIVVKVVPGEHLQNRGIRVSTHLYNTEREIDLLTNELKQIVAKA